MSSSLALAEALLVHDGKIGLAFDVLLEALARHDGITHQVMGKGPPGEPDDRFLSVLLLFGGSCQKAEEEHRGSLDDRGLLRGLEEELCNFLVGIGLGSADAVGLCTFSRKTR